MLGWLAPVRLHLESLCSSWQVPLGVVVGWIQEESGGNPAETTPLHEYGRFQIHPDESKDLGFDHERIRTDDEYGIACGFRLVDHYRIFTRSTLKLIDVSVPDGCEHFWRLVKFGHSIGAGAERKILALAGDEAQSWDRFSRYCADHQDELRQRVRHDPVKWVGLVDRVFRTGAPFGVEALICASDR